MVAKGGLSQGALCGDDERVSSLAHHGISGRGGALEGSVRGATHRGGVLLDLRRAVLGVAEMGVQLARAGGIARVRDVRRIFKRQRGGAEGDAAAARGGAVLHQG